MERFDVDIRDLDRALKQTSEIFEGVRVDNSIDILFGMVDDLVRVVRFKTLIRSQLVSVNLGAFQDVLFDVFLCLQAVRQMIYRRRECRAAAAPRFCRARSGARRLLLCRGWDAAS